MLANKLNFLLLGVLLFHSAGLAQSRDGRAASPKPTAKLLDGVGIPNGVGPRTGAGRKTPTLTDEDIRRRP